MRNWEDLRDHLKMKAIFTMTYEICILIPILRVDLRFTIAKLMRWFPTGMELEVPTKEPTSWMLWALPTPCLGPPIIIHQNRVPSLFWPLPKRREPALWLLISFKPQSDIKTWMTVFVIKWYNSQSNPTTNIVCGVESAHNRAKYLTSNWFTFTFSIIPIKMAAPYCVMSNN